MTPPERKPARVRALAWARHHLWPRTLFARIAVIVFSGLAIVHLLTFAWVQHERATLARSMTLTYLGQDVASSVAMLQHLPAAERGAWLPRLARQNYRYLLRPATHAHPALSPSCRQVTQAIRSQLEAPAAQLQSAQVVGMWLARPDDLSVQEVELHLNDGTPVTLQISPPPSGLAPGTGAVLGLQLTLLCAVTWFAVRLATRPLARMAAAADALAANLGAAPLSTRGPSEVARAAGAFNAMQRRLAAHLAERTQILAAVSHDLRTPLSRMRLRCDLLPDTELRTKLQADLAEMQSLVEEGLAYAMSSQAPTEPLRMVDLGALLEGLVADYRDAGSQVNLVLPPLSSALSSVSAPATPSGSRPIAAWTLSTRPQMLRRLLGNLVDNALKFAGACEIELDGPSARFSDAGQGGGAVRSLSVLDRGPGIPDAYLELAMQPFLRLESSRNRETGGTGLGLAIARQLAQALGADLVLSPRQGGGLRACVLWPQGGNPHSR